MTRKQTAKFFALFLICICFVYLIQKTHTAHFSDSNNGKVIPQDTRTIDLSIPTDMHRCTDHKVPLVSSPLDTAQHLLFTNKSFIRFGDGDIYLLMNTTVFYQTANPDLRERMMQIIKSDDSRLMIGLVDTFSDCYSVSRRAAAYWRSKPELRSFMEANLNMSRQYFSTIVSSIYTHSQYTYCHHLDLIYSTLKEIWRDKDIVLVRGNNSQIYSADIYETAKSQTVYYASRYNAWTNYQDLKTKILRETPEKLFIFSAGPVGKVLAYDLMLIGRRALDLGHLAKDYNTYMTNGSTNGFFHD